MYLDGQRISRRAALKVGIASAASIGFALPPGRAFARTPSQTSQLDAANLNFAFKLNALLAGASSSENLFFSPLSISLALAMVFNGARGSTLQALANATGFAGMSQADLNQAARALLAALQSRDPAVSLSIANSLWYRQGIAVSPTFAATLKSAYGANATALDFASPGAPVTINAWVNRTTHGLIPSIVHSIAPSDVLFLINALYFKAKWATQFSPSNTAPGPFTLASGQKKTLPLMNQMGTYGYRETALYQAISLPYAAGAFSMVIVLPSASSSLAQFQRGLNATAWQQLVSTLPMRYGRLVLPRFTVDYSASLRLPLSDLGMGIAFDPTQADLSGMFTAIRGFISGVQHRAVMAVNEQGTRAAAVTAIGVGATAMPMQTFTMVVDRPFFCVIRDNESGTVLFMGSIFHPQ